MNEIKILEHAKDFSLLYIENNPKIRASGVKLLKNYFEKLYVLGDEKGILEALEKVNPDILISDIYHIGENFNDIIRRSKKKNQNLQVIVTSFQAEASSLIDFFHLGITDYLMKPVESNSLKSAIVKAVSFLKDKKHLKELSARALIDKDDTFSALEVLYSNSVDVDILNHFKGIPVINTAKLEEIGDDHILIDTIPFHKSIIHYEKGVYIESKYLPKTIYARLNKEKSVDYKIYLDNLEYIEHSPRRRDKIRIKPKSDEFSAFVIKNNYKYKLDVIDLSSKYISARVINTELILGDKINVELDLFIAKSAMALDEKIKERIICKGSIFKADKRGGATVYVIELDLKDKSKEYFSKYIFQRELTLVREFKKIEKKN